MSLLLNIGSGQRPFEKPWINCDIQAKWKPDVVVDARSMPQFKDNSASMIVLHHVAEHAGCGEFHPVFCEAHRVLEPGGSLLVFVPDMRKLAERWLLKEMDDQLYFTNVYGAYNGDESDRHKWGFTLASLLRSLINAAHWYDIKRFDWRPIPKADIARDWWILGIEAVK
jgi:SAM-dependent methyltransferase